jgi:Spy/CpxP family protein refolding chaperone
MKKIMTTMTAILLMAILSSASFAQMGRGMGGRGMGRGMGEQGGGRSAQWQDTKHSLDRATAVPDLLLIDLDLTDEQASQITFLRDAHIKDIKFLKETLFSKRIHLNDLLTEKTSEQDKITSVRKEIKDIRDQIQDKTAQYLQAVRKILTSEQTSVLGSYWLIWDVI